MGFSFGYNKSDIIRGWNSEFNDGFIVYYSMAKDIPEQPGFPKHIRKCIFYVKIIFTLK